MAEIKCALCGHQWSLSEATTNRCPKCEAVVEVYYDREEAERVRDVYNTGNIPPSGVETLSGMEGYSVSFPDRDRLAEIADQLIRRTHE